MYAHLGASPPTRLHVTFQTRPSPLITVRMRNEPAAYNERLAGKAWERGYIHIKLLKNEAIHLQFNYPSIMLKQGPKIQFSQLKVEDDPTLF